MKSIKTIIIGISSSIAAYKILDLIKLLRKKRFEVRVVMTKHAAEMFDTLRFEKVSGNKVFCVLFPKRFDYKDTLKKRKVGHIDLASKASLVVVAPATANIIGKIANGIADDFLTTVVLAATAPVVICPAMNTNMWNNPAVCENIKKLRNRNLHILLPANGRLACGKDGVGRLIDIELISKKIGEIVNQKKRLRGQKIIITAGGTIEAIDSVRVITNRASGKMGGALAEQASYQGADVLLLRAKSAVSCKYSIKEEIFETGQDLLYLIRKHIKNYDSIFHTAAVSDFIPDKRFDKKLDGSKSLTIKLNPAQKIIRKIKKWNPKIKLIGFKAVYREKEENLIKIGIAKLKETKSDFVIVNDVGGEGIGFAEDDNEVYIISEKGLVAKINKAPKTEIARKILKHVITSEEFIIRSMSKYQAAVYKIVSQIPSGKVLTYQKIAQLAGMKSPRSVGNILHKNKDQEKTPCHRVVRSNGTIAGGYAFGGIRKQEEKLIREGVEIVNGRIDLARYLWRKKIHRK